ncbi:MAG TPA: cobalamin-dependent protein [Solirubrobacteraceae bacterium]|jgi:methanogenic corrinoid protein MtbC1
MKRERAISFDADVLDEAERRAGDDVSAFVNDAVRRELRTAAVTEAAVAGARAAGIEGWRDAYLGALLDRDPRRAREVVEGAVLAGVDVADLYIGVFGPVLAEIGHRWAMEELNVAHEHFATSVTQALMVTVAPGSRAAPAGGRLAVVSSVPDELHTLGTQMVADLLEREGWEVLMLGAATPARDLAELVEMERPDVVALSASTAGRLPGLAQVLPALTALEPRPLIVAGGSLFTQEAAVVALDLGADLVTSDVRVLLARLRERFPPVDGG